MAETTRHERRAERRTPSSPIPPAQRSVSIAAAERRAAARRAAGTADVETTDRWGGDRDDIWRHPAGGPSSQLVTVVLAGALAVGAMTGFGAGMRGPGVEPLVLAGGPSASATATAGRLTTATAAAAASSSASAGRGPAPAADKASFVTTPWARNYDFAVIKGIQQGADQVVTLTVDRLTFLTGAQAVAYYKAHPDQPQADYAIVNQNPRVYTFPVVTGAPLYGATTLAGTVAAQPITSAQLVSRAKQALAAGRPVHVWLHHDDHDLAWTTYLAEQYLP